MNIDLGTFPEPGSEPTSAAPPADPKTSFGDTIVIRSIASTLQNEKELQISNIPEIVNTPESRLPDNKDGDKDNFTDIAETKIDPAPSEKVEKKKGSVLKRLAAKFNPNQRKKDAYGADEPEPTGTKGKTAKKGEKETNAKINITPSSGTTSDINGKIADSKNQIDTAVFAYKDKLCGRVSTYKDKFCLGTNYFFC